MKLPSITHDEMTPEQIAASDGVSRYLAQAFMRCLTDIGPALEEAGIDKAAASRLAPTVLMSSSGLLLVLLAKSMGLELAHVLAAVEQGWNQNAIKVAFMSKGGTS